MYADERGSERNTDNEFHVYKDARGAWRWRLKAANGKIVADSSEGHSTKQACLNGVYLVKAPATFQWLKTIRASGDFDPFTRQIRIAHGNLNWTVCFGNFLPEDTTLLAPINPRNVPENLKRFVIQDKQIGSAVEILLRDELLLRLRGTKSPVLEYINNDVAA